MTMTAGSLFSGIGGLDAAAEALGFEVRWQVEYDPYRRSVLAHHWPQAKQYDDVRTLDFDAMERVDAVIGGFPCQPFSVAGKQKGADDARNLWPQTIRVIRELRPQWALLENVPGLLGKPKDRDASYFGTVLGELAEAGYDAEWACLRASDVGATHRRNRVFILAHRNREQGQELHAGEAAGATASRRDDAARQGEGLADAGRPRHERRGEGGDILRQEGEAQGEGVQRERGGRAAGDEGASVEHAEHDGRAEAEEPGVADAAAPGLEERPCQRGDGDQELPAPQRGAGEFPPGPDDRDGWAYLLAEVPSLEPAFCSVANGVPDRMARLRALGDSVVWQQAAAAFSELYERTQWTEDAGMGPLWR
jgi:DNA (cytosine-5)-methyltransferase 1